MSRGHAPSRGIYHGDSEWREETNFTWFPIQDFQSKAWRSPRSSESSEFRLTHQIVERVFNVPDFTYPAGFASAVYVADRHCGNMIIEKVIVKVFMRIPYLQTKPGKQYVSKQDLLSLKLPIVEEFADEVPREFQNELQILDHFRRHEFAYAPSLITSFEHHNMNPWVKDGFLGFIVMQKLSAVTVSDLWEYEPKSKAQLNEQLRIQEALKVSIVELTNVGVAIMDRAPRNLMWDSKTGKCYFIDFEIAAIDAPPRQKQTWESLTSHRRSPLLEFDGWCLLMKDQAHQLRNDIWSARQGQTHRNHVNSPP